MKDTIKGSALGIVLVFAMFAFIFAGVYTNNEVDNTPSIVVENNPQIFQSPSSMFGAGPMNITTTIKGVASIEFYNNDGTIAKAKENFYPGNPYSITSNGPFFRLFDKYGNPLSGYNALK